MYWTQRGSTLFLVGQEQAEQACPTVCLVWGQLQPDPPKQRSDFWPSSVIFVQVKCSVIPLFLASAQCSLSQLVHAHPFNCHLWATLHRVLQVCHPQYTVAIHKFLQGIKYRAKRWQCPTCNIPGWFLYTLQVTYTCLLRWAWPQLMRIQLQTSSKLKNRLDYMPISVS